MMKTILVDDEFWSIEQFKIECENVNGINVIGYFDNPLEAIDFCANNHVEVAMLDIEMPEINGIELAKRLREIHPQIVIVFVTAYDNYLLESIKISADYYLLKPYTFEDISNVVEKAKLLVKRQEKRIRVSTFGQFDVFIDGVPAKFNGKKVKELFALLVDKKGHPLNTEEAFSYLWEGEEYNNASASKYRKLWARLHEFLEENNLSNLINVNKGEKSLNCDMIECDYFDFLNGNEKAIKKFTFTYMSDYWWGENTLADLTDMKYSYDEKQ